MPQAHMPAKLLPCRGNLPDFLWRVRTFVGVHSVSCCGNQSGHQMADCCPLICNSFVYQVSVRLTCRRATCGDSRSDKHPVFCWCSLHSYFERLAHSCVSHLRQKSWIIDMLCYSIVCLARVAGLIRCDQHTRYFQRPFFLLFQTTRNNESHSFVAIVAQDRTSARWILLERTCWRTS